MYKITIPVRCSTAYRYKEETLAELKRCGAHRVAITLWRDIEYKFSSEETLGELRELIAYFEEQGLETLVWIGQTIGHDRLCAPVRDWGYTNTVNLDGERVTAFCPLDEKFIADCQNWVKNIAKCKPKLIILDDDFRMGEFFGCCCELHMERVRRELSEDISIPELKSKILNGGESRYRDAYLKVQGDGLREISARLREALDEVDPSIRLGACITPGRWESDGADPIEIGRILAGKTKPFIRFFGAPYHHPAISLPNSIERERTQAYWMRESGFEMISEGDTYPRPRFACPAAYLECFDMILRASGCMDGIMKYMLDYVSSPTAETGYRRAAESNAQIYHDIERLFSGGECVGISPFLRVGALRKAELSESEGYNHMNDIPFTYNSSYGVLTDCALPICYGGDGVQVIFGNSAWLATSEQLKNGAIIDIDAAKILMQDGVDVGLESVSDEDLFVQDGFDDVPIEYFPDFDEYIRLDPLRITKYSVKDGALPQSKIVKGDVSKTFTFLYENSDGQRFLVLPFSARACIGKIGYFKSYLRKHTIARSVKWLSGKELAVYTESDDPGIYLLAKEDCDGISVGIWNISPDKAHNVRLRLGDDYAVAEFVGCEGHLDGRRVSIDSVLHPYEFAGVRLTKL